MKPPTTIIFVLFIMLTTACGSNSTVNIGPPQGSGTPSGSSGPANQPVSETSPGTQTPADGCDPNYSPCVPIAIDVDCEGGMGNGPAYVKGPIKVIGKDIYGLDRDGNGTGCE